MRRRTRKLSSSRAVVYIVLLAFVWGAKYIYNNYVPTTENSTPEATILVTSSQAQPEESPRSDDAPKHRLSGWAELPAERNQKELYYAYHLIEEEDSADKRRNYAVCFNSDKHCPVWVAAAMHPSFTGDTKRIDSYQYDPQLPVNIQPQLKRSYGEDYSRGHLLGSAERNTSRAANIQTFYVTNIAPQIRIGFNSAGGAWNNLESFVDKQICADTLYVVTGCIFSEFSDTDGSVIAPTTTTNRNDEKQIGVPTAYYKALLRTRKGDSGKSVTKCKASELKCAAFIVGHRTAKGRKPSAKEMLTIEELEQLTGEKFFINVKHAPKQSAEPSDWGL
ncbi:MAG: DNA/RNA non-specific endonuclease [Alistipes sp.]|nr:DNA/RNA non-specific endonuclease [Alistipes sp.]